MPSSYVEYLQTRSRLGLWYRNLWLYPRICRYTHGNVLDFGCGIGDFLHFCDTATGVNINPEEIKFCHTHGLEVSLLRNSKIPFSDDTFDSIVMDNVLEHIPTQNADATIQEITRVLIAGGTFIIGVPKEKGYASDPDHKQFYNKNNLIELLKPHKYELETCFHMPFPFPYGGKLFRQSCLYAVFKSCDQ